MNILRTLRTLLVATGVLLADQGLRGAELGIEFTGFVRDDRGLSLGLRNTASGDTKWISIGQEFAGYTARSLDEKAEVLIVTKDKAEYRLPLTRAKIRQVDLEPPPELKKKVLNNLRQLAAAADQYYLENGKSTTTFDELVGATKYVKRINPVDGEVYTGLAFTQGKALQVTTSGGYTIKYDP